MARRNSKVGSCCEWQEEIAKLDPGCWCKLQEEIAEMDPGCSCFDNTGELLWSAIYDTCVWLDVLGLEMCVGIGALIGN